VGKEKIDQEKKIGKERNTNSKLTEWKEKKEDTKK
jgi:hypothetical protein